MNKVLIGSIVFVLVVSVVVVIFTVVVPALSSQKNGSPTQTTMVPTGTPAPPNPDDYELYGDYIWPPRQVESVTFLPSINQYVFMAVTFDPRSATPTYLKMVSQDNTQARFVEANNLDTTSIFDPSKWNNGYGVVDGHYKVRLKCPRPTTDVYPNPSLTTSGLNPNDFEMYGDWIGKPSPVQYIAYVQSINQNVYMHMTRSGDVKMVSQDNTQARVKTIDPMTFAEDPDTIDKSAKWATIFDPSKWNTYTNADTHYLVRSKCR